MPLRKVIALHGGSDVSEKGFTRNGVAVDPEVKKENLPGSDQAKWLNISQKDSGGKRFSK